MKLILAVYFTLLSFSACADNAAFSGWMNKTNLDNYFEILNKGDTESTLFEKGHWISAVEGRWNGNEVEYRVVLDQAPDRPFEWWWWINQKHGDFVEKMRDYEKRGIPLIYAQSFYLPNGTALYQGVWMK